VYSEAGEISLVRYANSLDDINDHSGMFFTPGKYVGSAMKGDIVVFRGNQDYICAAERAEKGLPSNQGNEGNELTFANEIRQIQIKGPRVCLFEQGP
jgi:hypothetical protein